MKKFCRNCAKVQETYWELETCDKNPEGLIPEPNEHGNIIAGTVTCEDGYCNPRYVSVEEELITKEYIKTHEIHERCSHCNQFLEAM